MVKITLIILYTLLIVLCICNARLSAEKIFEKALWIIAGMSWGILLVNSLLDFV